MKSRFQFCYHLYMAISYLGDAPGFDAKAISMKARLARIAKAEWKRLTKEEKAALEKWLKDD